MRLSCLQENLSRGLGIVSSAVAARTTYPVMQNVLITTDNARLKLAATNQEIAISTWIGAQIEDEGEVTIPARLLTEFINSLPAERIDLDYTDQPVGISVKCARFSAQINGHARKRFPSRAHRRVRGRRTDRPRRAERRDQTRHHRRRHRGL